MVNRMQFYIDGAWVDPVVKKSTPVVNPATEEAMYEVALGSKADVDKAVAAARRAFETFSQTSREERVALLAKIIEVYKTRMKDIGAAVSDEMGAPLPMAEKLQAGAGLGHIASTLEVLKNYHFEEPVGSAMVVREPVGVIGMITPWNWPLNQIACKVAPALAAGCTMILKPSEFTPTSALIFAEILHEAGVPKGVFNLINGLGPEVGAAMSEHPDIDMISFTGSTRAGIDVAKRAAPTVKRVSQELGGKSPNIILEGADLTKAVTGGVMHMFNNSGQSCNAPSRMIVPLSKMKEVAAIAKGVADKTKAGDPRAEGTTIGPVVYRIQWDKIQAPDPEGHRGRRHAGRRRSRPAGRRQQGLLCAPDHLRRRHQRHDHRARGNLRAGAHHPRRQGRSRRGEDRQRHAVWSGRLRLRRHRRDARARSAARSAPATSTCRACRTTAPRRSAATSSPATAANGANTAWRNISRSRRSPASTPRKVAESNEAPGRSNPLRRFLLRGVTISVVPAKAGP